MAGFCTQREPRLMFCASDCSEVDIVDRKSRHLKRSGMFQFRSDTHHRIALLFGEKGGRGQLPQDQGIQ